MASITIRNIAKKFGELTIIPGLDLEIADEEFVVFVGPSGCGKSTLLRIIAGLEPSTSGELFIGETKVNDVPASKRDIAMVFQDYALYPHMTVYDNLWTPPGRVEHLAALGIGCVNLSGLSLERSRSWP